MQKGISFITKKIRIAEIGKLCEATQKAIYFMIKSYKSS